MLTQEHVRPAAAAPSPQKAQTWRVALAMLAMAALVIGLRLVRLRSAYDLFIDEVTYRNIARSVAHGGLPRVENGKAFFLHPAGYFYIVGPFLDLFHHHDVTSDVMRMRAFNAVFSGFSAASLVLLGYRARGLLAGVAVTLVFAVEPYALRQNGRALIETVALSFVLLGYACTLQGMSTSSPRRRWWWLSGCGVFFGLAIVTKDYTAFITLLPVLWFLLRGRLLQRTDAYRMLMLGLLPYAIYVGSIFGVGAGGEFLRQKTIGIQRLLGLVKTTGFKHEGPGLTSTLIGQTSTFGGTYLILALGALLLLRDLRRGRGALDVLGVFHLSALALLSYSVLFGTLEEQFLYLLVVPTIITAVLSVHPAVLQSRWPRLLTAAVIALMFLFNLKNYVQTRPQRDDAWLQTRAWLLDNVPRGTRLVTRDFTGEFLLYPDGYSISTNPFASGRAASHPSYLVLSRKNVLQGYWHVPGAKVLGPQGVASQADLVFSAPGYSNQAVQVYRFRPGTDALGP